MENNWNIPDWLEKEVRERDKVCVYCGGEFTPAKVSKKTAASWVELKEKTLTDAEQTFLKNALSQYQGDIKKVAENMEISTRAVYSKLKKHQINVSSYR